MAVSPCLICNNAANNELLTVKELQLGFGEAFTYQLCSNCGSLQITDPPNNFTKYYPNQDYYSFKKETRPLTGAGLFRRIKTNYLLYGKNPVAGKLITIGYREPEYYPWMKHTNVKPADAILDVGCGTGDLLRKLYKMGFTNLRGIDPFIDEEINYGGFKIEKKDIFQVNEPYNLVMMHHALEHMPDPLAALKKGWQLLKKDSYLLVRIPVMGNFGWKKFREYWSGIDAPRHIFVPSEKGMKMLAEKAGLTVERIVYDSTDYMIWSSEQYRQGIPLYDKRSYMVNRKDGYFSKDDVKRFKVEIEIENKKQHADTAAFYLKKIQT